MTVLVPTSFLIILYSISNVIAKDIAESSNLRAVTRFEGIEGYYRNLRKQKSDNPPQESEERSANIKKEICRNIFTSHYFKILTSKDWIDLDDVERRAELEDDQYREIFNLIYVPSQNQRGEREYEYENAYEKRLVIYSFLIGQGPDFEYSFCCVVRDRQTDRLEPYFVSQEYNVNLNQFNVEPIAGRFIFAPLGINGMELRGMAEEAAFAGSELARLLLVTATTYEFSRFKYPSATPTPLSDPLCQLSAPNKLRLCASFFAADAFTNKLIFEPTIENVQLDCVKKKVWISSSWRTLSYMIQRMNPEFMDEEYGVIEEWMIGCKALVVGSDNQNVYYYVSRSNKPNTIYAYTDISIDQVTLFYNYFENISVSKVIEAENDVSFLQQDVEE